MKTTYYISAYDPIMKQSYRGQFEALIEAEAIAEACAFWQIEENDILKIKESTSQKNYCITENEIEEIENIVSYFKYHNKNLTKNQDYMLYKLEIIADHIRDYYCGDNSKNDLYLIEEL